jgi:putative (di)nucleoside polyphosphate hydrolase
LTAVGSSKVQPVPGLKYQPNVAAILRNPEGKIFVGERQNNPGAWQFPQGGVDAGESHETAIQRELWEEIGVLPQDYDLGEKRGPFYYEFPDGLTKRGHQGKQQWYFICSFHADDERINVATEHPEFRAWRWILPEEFSIKWLPEMKRAVYRQVFNQFFGIKWAEMEERH